MTNRIIGTAGKLDSDTVLVVIGATHGNEHEGIQALTRVFDQLRAAQLQPEGYLVGLCGNREAAQQNRRYLGHDLNRIWTPQHLQQMHTDALPEYAEMRELESIILGLEPRSRQRAVLLDIHTTSSPNGTFWVSMPSSDVDLMRQSNAPIIHGLHEVSGLPGTTTVYFGQQGYATHALEGGQHGTEQAVQNLQAVLWQVMAHLGMVTPTQARQHAPTPTTMDALCRSGVPQELTFCYRHAITSEDRFKSVPGLKNFDFIPEGTLLAHDRHGPVYAPQTGYLLMPLYQDEGSDGFFLVKP